MNYELQTKYLQMNRLIQNIVKKEGLFFESYAKYIEFKAKKESVEELGENNLTWENQQIKDEVRRVEWKNRVRDIFIEQLDPEMQFQQLNIKLSHIK